MFDLDLGWPLSLGVVAAFNPCGFAMLPAYVGFFMGQEAEDETNTARNIARAFKVGAALTAGFIFVFGTLGILTNTIASAGAIQSRIGYATITFGVLMVPLGIAMLRGYEPKLNIPRLNKGGGDSNLVSIFLFGVSYAVVSVSCTIGLFLTVVAGSFTEEGFVGGVGYFVAYALGMGAVMMVLTLGVALARNSVARNMRRFLPYVNKVSGVMLILAGIFLTGYGYWQLRLADGNTDDVPVIGPIIHDFEEASATVNQWANDAGPNRLAMGALVLLVGAVVWAVAKSLKEARDRNLVVGGFAVVYAFIEIFRYEFDLLILPLVRTIGDIPERVGNWFTDPFRYAVLFELLLAAAIGAIIYFTLRSRFRKEDEDAGKTLVPA